MIQINKYAGKALAAMPCTALALQQTLELSRSHTYQVLIALKGLGLTHISHYTKTKYANAPLYAAGAGVDADYPKKPIRVREPQPKPVKEPKLPFKLPERCQPKVKIVMLNSPYRTVWVKGNPFAQMGVM